MPVLVVSLALLLGFVVGACAEPEEEELGSFPCGAEECDVRSEICYVADQCDGSMGARSCQAVPDACDGRATAACVSTGGRGCSQDEAGGFTCSPSCG